MKVYPRAINKKFLAESYSLNRFMKEPREVSSYSQTLGRQQQQGEMFLSPSSFFLSEAGKFNNQRNDS